jgi:hypothetical protein
VATVESTVFVALLGEAVDVWSPVQAIDLGGGVFRLPPVAPDDENWAFSPGSFVRCERRTLDGDEVLVVCALA